MATGRNNEKTKHLTSDKEAFCRLMAFESSTTLNQTEVYAKTHDTKKLTKKSMGELASRLMKDVKIMARIEELRKPVVERFKVHHEAWLAEIMDLAFANPQDLFDEHGNTLELPSLPKRVAKIIQGFEVQELFIGKQDENRVAAGYTRKFKLANKLEALELFGKAMGWLPDKGTKIGLRAEIQGKDQCIRVEFVEAPARP